MPDLATASAPVLSANRAETLVQVLSEISRAVAESLELREVFSRVADATKKLLPFMAMGVTRFDEAGRLILYAEAGDEAEPDATGRIFETQDISPTLGSSTDGILRVKDASRELDGAYALDRLVLEYGTRSILGGPLRRGEKLLGGVWFASYQPNAFGEEDEALVGPIADLLALALEHERLSSAERDRRTRNEVLEQLVPTLAQALDVRDVFDQVSSIARQVLPHDRLAVGLFTEDRASVRIFAYSGERVPDMPDSFPIKPTDVPPQDFEFEIVGDIEKEWDRTTEKFQLLMKNGIRSSLRVPIRLEGRIAGGLVFHSKTPHAFQEEDVAIARRVADQVTLALSHQRLADEANKAAQARAEAACLEERVVRLTEELESRDGFARIVGTSKSWRDVLVQAAKVAPTETTVLLTGESGTGKEVIARAIHRASSRAKGPFSAINCAALPDQLLESELFGYEKGAFTGATGAKPGRIEQAAGGVLFLDEAGEMSPAVQAKLLRVLQEREFTRLGGTRSQKAEVRIVAATNRDLKDAIGKGEFREDLYYRLHVFEIRLPPLRERADDILLLTESFLKELGQVIGRPAAGVSKEAKELLLSYPWPGNVRELKNALERAVILAEGGLIAAAHFPIALLRVERTNGAALGSLPAGGLDLESLERSLVKEALEKAANNKSKAAKLLGLTRAQLYSRIEKFGLA